MMIIRPLAATDADALLQLAHKAGVGFTSLPPDRDLIQAKVDASLRAFTEAPGPSQEQSYVLVLEDTDSGQVVGLCGIESRVGLTSPWYNYRIGTLVHASRELGVHNRFPTLYLSNDHTGCAEVCTLFLDPDYRHSKNGSLLSKCRFLLLAEFSERFESKIIAEMRGVSDEQGRSPFWQGLGDHFFTMPFAEADRLTGLGQKQFIAELMPRHPLYINLLPQAAQDVIAEVHQNTKPARKMLEDEGFRYQGYVDIFDAGPTLETQVQDIRAVRDSRYYKVQLGEPDPQAPLCLVSNTDLQGFRCALAPLSLNQGDRVTLSSELAAALGVGARATVRAVPLFS